MLQLMLQLINHILMMQDRFLLNMFARRMVAFGRIKIQKLIMLYSFL